MTERQYLAALYSFLPFGPARTGLLIKYFGSARNAWRASKKRLLETNLSEPHVNKFISYRSSFDKNYFKHLKEMNIDFVTYNEKKFPSNLKGIDDCPLVLYFKGALTVGDINAVAIIGSRKMTSYGKRVAYDFSAELASKGVTIISGLALGIDAVAHRAAVEAGGRTIAVIASGLDNITPVTNRRLADRFVKDDQGAVISEFPIRHRPQRHDFAVRNRIISGLSKAVVIVEGEQKSGTLLTASHAAQQGRQVFAVPGQITSPLSEAPHFLLRNGASLANNVRDILEELDMQLKVNREEVERVLPEDQIEELIMKILEREAMHLDEIVRRSEMTTSEITAKLSIMEIKGLVKNLGNGNFQL